MSLFGGLFEIEQVANKWRTNGDCCEQLGFVCKRKETTMTWLKAATIRALKTAAQAAIGAIGTGAVGLFQADWANVLSIALMAAVISYLTSLAGLPEVDDGETPSSYEAKHMGGGDVQ